MKLALVRSIEVALIRAVANGQLAAVVEAENLSPGEGIVLLYFPSGRKAKVTIEMVPE